MFSRISLNGMIPSKIIVLLNKLKSQLKNVRDSVITTAQKKFFSGFRLMFTICEPFFSNLFIAILKKFNLNHHSQKAFTLSKSATKTLEKGVKYVQS